MHIRHPVTVLVGISSLLSFLITIIPPFFGTTCIGLTHALFEIGQIILAFNSFCTSLCTTSCIDGFNLLQGSTIGLYLSSIKILCVQIEGLIPLMSEMVQPKAFLCSRKILSNFSFFTSLKELLIITGKVESWPKKAYLKFDGNGLSSSLGGSSGGDVR